MCQLPLAPVTKISGVSFPFVLRSVDVCLEKTLRGEVPGLSLERERLGRDTIAHLPLWRLQHSVNCNHLPKSPGMKVHQSFITNVHP